GIVTTTYVPQPGNAPGTYTLKAVGSLGTRAQGKLTIEGAAPAESKGCSALLTGHLNSAPGDDGDGGSAHGWVSRHPRARAPQVARRAVDAERSPGELVHELMTARVDRGGLQRCLVAQRWQVEIVGGGGVVA